MNNLSNLSLVDTISAAGVTRSLRDIEQKINDMLPVLLGAADESKFAADPYDYGAYGDGSHDDTAAFLKAKKVASENQLVRTVRVSTGRFVVTGDQIVLGNDGVTDSTGVKFLGNGSTSTIVRGSSGRLIDIWVDGVQFDRLDIDGNGVESFTGEDIRVTASGRAFAFDRGSIRNSPTRCIHFEPDRGTYARVFGSQFWRYTPGGDYSDLINNPGGATETIRPPGACIYIGDDSNNPQHRVFMQCNTSPFHDLLDDGGQLTTLLACYTHNHRMRSNAKKSAIVACRITPHGEYFVMRGIEHTAVANRFGNVVQILNEVNNATLIGNMHTGDAFFPSGIDDQSAPGTNCIVGGTSRSAFLGAFMRNAGETRVVLPINPGTVAAGGRAEFLGLSFPGAIPNMKCACVGSVLSGLMWFAEIVSLSVVNVYVMNMSSSPVTPGSVDVTITASL